MVTRIIAFVVAFFAIALSALGAPLLEKRIEHDGQGTWYYPGLGNCGFTDSDTSPVVAISKQLYDENAGGNCNQWVQITANGNTVYAQTRDSCPGCAYNDLDMSPSIFSQLASLDVGRIDIEWHFMDKEFSP